MVGYIGLFIWIIFSIIGISQNYTHYSTADWIVILFILFVPCFAVFKYKSRKAKTTAQKNREITQVLDEQRQSLLNLLDNYSTHVISSPSIMLKKNELAYLEQTATLLITQNKMIGSTGRSSGSSIRIAKGVYLRSGGSGSQRIYKDVTTQYSGLLSITNQRISFMHPQKAFEISLEKLTNMSSTCDELVLQQSNKSYVLDLSNADIIEQLIRKLYAK